MSLFKHTSFLDFHTHSLKRESEKNITEIVSLHLGQEKEHHYFTIAQHPWFTEKNPSSLEVEILKEKLKQPNCLAMGEMGLDNIKGPDLDIQMNILRNQLQIAEELDKPVIIHCVRAYDQLYQIKKEFPSIKKWCIHGYARHATLALQLIHQGFHLSLMPVFTITDKYKKLLREIPLDKFFLETDSMPNIQIEDIYLQAANILEVPLSTLQEQIIHNAESFFNHE